MLYVNGWTEDPEASRMAGIDLARRALRVAGEDPARLYDRHMCLAKLLVPAASSCGTKRTSASAGNGREIDMVITGIERRSRGPPLGDNLVQAELYTVWLSAYCGGFGGCRVAPAW
jgi:hypothetical protein